jgi:endoglucanase
MRDAAAVAFARAVLVGGMLVACGAERFGVSHATAGESAPTRDGVARTDTDAGKARLHVVGNRLIADDSAIRLLGLDHAGSEYACIERGGYGVFEGPDPDALAVAMLGWGHVNAVRLPLNEDCWLGINGVSAAFGGQAYRAAIVAYASTLHAHGLFTILDLHWSAPGAFASTAQQPMADADHAPAFWRSVAATFAGDSMAIFDLYNEPYVDTSNAQTADPWACWRNGCTITRSVGGVTGSWKSAGMQDLVDAVRSTGASNVLMLGGLGYANELSGWLAHEPSDPLGQLAASFHLYNFNPCASESCWDVSLADVAQHSPVVTGELGENDCGHALVDAFLPWADAHGVSYLGWTWNTWDCNSGPALITAYDGTPTAFGEGLRAHLLVARP